MLNSSGRLTHLIFKTTLQCKYHYYSHLQMRTPRDRTYPKSHTLYDRPRCDSGSQTPESLYSSCQTTKPALLLPHLESWGAWNDGVDWAIVKVLSSTDAVICGSCFTHACRDPTQMMQNAGFCCEADTGCLCMCVCV